ncbi:hypothetical protein BDR04DRAFT_1102142 [Suillus decipiens]|nr:hypothetical protein BDR04DRAFT_1102142 [Suillus decipiens]
MLILYIRTTQAFLPGGHRTGAPGKHVIRGASKYCLLGEKVRVFVVPSIEEIKKSELKPYVGKDIKLTMVQKRELWNIMPKSPAQSAPSSRTNSFLF